MVAAKKPEKYPLTVPGKSINPRVQAVLTTQNDNSNTGNNKK